MAKDQECASASSCGRESCEGCPSHQGGAPVDFSAKLGEGSSVKKVIAVVSGKGGVGKSLVTAMLACAMRRTGKNVAVLDADITGPSMGKDFGVSGSATGDDVGIFPLETTTGIELVTANMFLPNEDDPVIWRGPVVSGMVKQFWSEVHWDNIDYMFVDMPPGTGDVPLTVFQSLPVDGIVIVTSPQELVGMIVGKAVKMAKMMNIPILGIVENFSFFRCPDNGKEYEIFGPSHLIQTAAAYDLDILARLPIDPLVATACDLGQIESIESEAMDNCIKLIEGKLA
ncbi:MAG: Mrp/NBP35 family ATP-binding protein [Phascolarctobacterium sp.]|nr:Mrp/NBP35 family ATP-binding protein [Phascolarctobacterium sp.]